MSRSKVGGLNYLEVKVASERHKGVDNVLMLLPGR